MKNLIVVLGTIFILVIAAIAFASPKYSSTTETVLLVDKTDSVDLNGLASSIITDIEKSPVRYGYIFRALDLNDKRLNGQHFIDLDEGTWYEDQIDRKKEHKDFVDGMRGMAEEITVQATSLRSSLYHPISVELNRLCNSTADVRRMIINSDLMENSIIDFYDKETYRLLLENPDLIISQLLELNPLNDLTGITVYLVYLPSDELRDEQFDRARRIYIKMLEDKGATVIYQANLNLTNI